MADVGEKARRTDPADAASQPATIRAPGLPEGLEPLGCLGVRAGLSPQALDREVELLVGCVTGRN
jgi:hypothetical protein